MKWIDDEKLLKFSLIFVLLAAGILFWALLFGEPAKADVPHILQNGPEEIVDAKELNQNFQYLDAKNSILRYPTYAHEPRQLIGTSEVTWNYSQAVASVYIQLYFNADYEPILINWDGKIEDTFSEYIQMPVSRRLFTLWAYDNAWLEHNFRLAPRKGRVLAFEENEMTKWPALFYYPPNSPLYRLANRDGIYVEIFIHSEEKTGLVYPIKQPIIFDGLSQPSVIEVVNQ